MLATWSKNRRGVMAVRAHPDPSFHAAPPARGTKPGMAMFYGRHLQLPRAPPNGNRAASLDAWHAGARHSRGKRETKQRPLQPGRFLSRKMKCEWAGGGEGETGGFSVTYSKAKKSPLVTKMRTRVR